MSKNFEITAKENGQKYWISRAVAVCAIVIVYDENGMPNILINKRGAGTPDFQHCWNIPCGYLDWDETTSQACSREVFEECNILINDCMWVQYGDIEDSPESNRQNVTIRKITELDWDQYLTAVEKAKNTINRTFGEENEVENIELMPLTQYEINNHKWAFNHKKLVERIMDDVDNGLGFFMD